ncbi:MAG: hypothetical protein Q9207_008218 [Kuettlingeria erythrocarpa]
MVQARKYIVRPSRAAKTDYKESLKIHLSATALHYHGLKPGDLCQLSTTAQVECLATAWLTSDKINDTIIQTSKTLQTLCDLKLGDQVTLSRWSSVTEKAHFVLVSEYGHSEGVPSLADLDPTETVGWSWVLKNELKKAMYLCPGMIFARLSGNDQERTFRIASIDDLAEKRIYHSTDLQSVVITTDTERFSASPKDYDLGLHSLDLSHVGGLKPQMSRLDETIEAFSSTAEKHRIFLNQPPARQGIILHGPAGTGKSMLLGILAKAGWRGVFRISRAVGSGRIEETEKAIRNTFIEARRLQPSIIIVDDLEAIAGKSGVADDSLNLNLANGICKAFDELCDDHMLVVAATRRLAAIDGSLRCSSRFNQDIEIPVPSTDARFEILNVAVGRPKDMKDHRLFRLAERTHGYTGSDLYGLVRVAMEKAASRIRGRDRGRVDSGSTDVGDKLLSFPEGVTEDEIEEALLEMRPTAMKEIFLDTPKVKWSDIGGQAEVKEALKMAVEWPLKYLSRMERKGLTPSKGLLLYGPSGCSKTLVAKAVATEAQLNFIAVKGAELLTMYVGESERKVRELFDRARGARPSIIFFDEIDAIGAARHPSEQGGLHVLTTLLNELDGIEPLHGVFVLAATNNPEMLDWALVRRLESALYVGLPDYDARLGIFAIRSHAMDLAADIDFAYLAKVTEGHTGAELVQMCSLAGRESLKEELECGIQSSIAEKHFRAALSQVPRRVTEEMVLKYKAWSSKVSRSWNETDIRVPNT